MELDVLIYKAQTVEKVLDDDEPGVVRKNSSLEKLLIGNKCNELGG